MINRKPTTFLNGCTNLNDDVHAGWSSAAIEEKMKEIRGEMISRQMINRKRTTFLNGCTDLNDDAHAGWSSVIDKDAINTVCWLMEQDVQVQVSKIEKYFQNVVCNPFVTWNHLPHHS